MQVKDIQVRNQRKLIQAKQVLQQVQIEEPFNLLL